ncbi:MAG: 50S ribosomal protein L21 [Alphaproteobacteria bacterium]|nr:50S ribosomal protein L21 [Alphaproteobacteria bacterium]
MYAVVRTGGKQYRVAKDDVIVVEKLAGEAGADVELDQVLMLDDGSAPVIGTPLVDGARVAATVLDQSRADKIIVFKRKRRKDYRRTKGHRQHVTVLRVTDILAKGQKASPKAEAKPASPAAEAATKGEAKAAAPAKKAAKKAPAKKAPAKKAPAKKAPAKKAAKKAPAKKS